MNFFDDIFDFCLKNFDFLRFRKIDKKMKICDFFFHFMPINEDFLKNHHFLAFCPQYCKKVVQKTRIVRVYPMNFGRFLAILKSTRISHRN